jgi:porin
MFAHCKGAAAQASSPSLYLPHLLDSNTANPAQPLPPALPDPDANSVKPFQPLAGEGITLLNYTGEAAGNVSGGLRQDAAYTGQVYLGADFDLDRIAVKGGAIHFAVTNRHGKSLSAIALGNNTSVQEVWGRRTPISRS